jgi:hypothetical protein
MAKVIMIALKNGHKRAKIKITKSVVHSPTHPLTGYALLLVQNQGVSQLRIINTYLISNIIIKNPHDLLKQS